MVVDAERDSRLEDARPKKRGREVMESFHLVS
jgi:hypothetical protein